MDFSSLMDRLVLKYSSNTSNSLSLDHRTLGTVATISITLGVYRILSAVAASRSDSKQPLTMSEVFELIRLCLGSLFLGNSKAFTNGGGQNGWSLRSKNGATSVSGATANNREMKRFDGSCHCQSVRFVVSFECNIVGHVCICCCDEQVLIYGLIPVCISWSYLFFSFHHVLYFRHHS